MSTKMSAGKWVVYFVLTVVFAVILEFDLFPGDFWMLVALSIPLVLTVSLAAYLVRPSVRETIRVYVPFYQGNRAAIRGDFVRAERCYSRALSLAESFGPTRDFFVGTALSCLADVYRTRGQLAAAEPVLLRALRHLEACARAVTTGAAAAWRSREVVALNLAAVCINQGRYAEAEPLCRDALAALKSDPAGGAENRAVALHNLGQIEAGRGRFAEAEALTRQALTLVARRVNRVSSAVWIVNASLADLCRRQGRLDEAEPLARTALTLAEKSVYGPHHPQLCRFLNVMAEIVCRQGRFDEAESLCRRSQALTEQAFGPNHLRLDSCLATLARIRISQGRPGEAESLLRRCLSILDAVVMPEHIDRLARAAEYAALLRQLGRPQEAEQWDARPKPLQAREQMQQQFFLA